MVSICRLPLSLQDFRWTSLNENVIACMTPRYTDKTRTHTRPRNIWCILYVTGGVLRALSSHSMQIHQTDYYLSYQFIFKFIYIFIFICVLRVDISDICTNVNTKCLVPHQARTATLSPPISTTHTEKDYDLWFVLSWKWQLSRNF